MFDPAALASYGLPGLFVLAFLAGSVVPLPSDALLAAMIFRGEPFVISVAVATVGNTLGAATLFWLGAQVANGRGGPLGRWLKRRTEKDPVGTERARARVARWGAPALLMSWMPIVGDAVVIAAGIAGVGRWSFLLYTTTGKTIRFTAVALTALAAASS